MSQQTSKDSDDEFQDALDQTPPSNINTKPNDQMMDELIQKQTDLALSDEEDDVEGKKDQRLDQEAATDSADIAEAEEIRTEGEDEDEEEQQREREKSLSTEELLANKAKADSLKIVGNEHFKEERVDPAIDAYTEALKICPTTYTKERAILFGNRAAAKIKLDAKKSAIDDCTRAIKLWPEYVRAVLRRAKLYELEDNLENALEDYKRVVELDPGQHEARAKLFDLPPMIEQRNERLKEEMFSKLKDLGNMVLKPFGLSTENFKMQQDPNTGSYSINFNQQ